MYIIPLITFFPNMEGVAHRNENCNVCTCILFTWSPISTTWKGFLTEMRIAMSARVYYSLDHLFPQHGRGFSQKWELQCLYVYILPLITHFLNMEWVAERNENCNVCMCILFLWSPISKHRRGYTQKWELQCLYVYIYSFDSLFPNIEGVTHRNENCNVCMCNSSLDHAFPKHGVGAERNENCNVCMCILFLWSPISKHRRGYTQKWELQCLYVYIITMITYFPTWRGFAHRNENCNVCMCILFPWSPTFPTWRGLLTEMRIAMSEWVILFPWSPTFPTWRELLIEMRIAMSVYVYFSFDHHFHQHGESCS